LLYHPDKNKSLEAKSQFIKIQEAYQILGNEEKRKEYDRFTDTSNVLYDFVINLFSSQLDDFISKTKTHKKTADIQLKISASLDEIYKSAVKMVKVKVLRNNVYQTIQLGVRLTDFWDPSIFENEGDNRLSNVIVTVDVEDHETYSVDNVLKTYDVNLERSISLYEMYCGCDLELPYLGGTTIQISKPPGVDRMIVVKKGFGMPYNDGTQRGDLYVFFRLTLPFSIPSQALPFLESYFKGGDEQIKRFDYSSI